MSTRLKICPKCGTENYGLETYCRTCGNMMENSYQNQQMQPPPNYGAQGQIPGAEKKMLAGLLGIFLGGLGVHKFVLGYTNEGIIMLLVSLVGGFFTCGITSLVVSIIGIVEGIMYLTKSDQEFVQTYVQNKKPWF
jgi:TM2 domain-containing membrane protein YozV/rRNA maturation protein Nop10